jgi:hypothetical protein
MPAKKTLILLITLLALVSGFLATATATFAAQSNMPTQRMLPNSKMSSSTAAPPGMVRITGGEFSMGSDEANFTDARPWHRVYVDAFWIDKTEVTNQQFARFVRATGHVTVAERKPDPKDYPRARPENLVAGSLVFDPPKHPVPLDNPYQWWSYVPGANWRHPADPTNNLRGRAYHPLVQVAYDDAKARSLLSRPTVMAFTTWPEMFGNGHPIGTVPITIRLWRQQEPLSAIRRVHQTALIQPNLAFLSAYSVAAHFCAVSNIAPATWSVLAARERPTPAQSRWFSLRS